MYKKLLLMAMALMLLTSPSFAQDEDAKKEKAADNSAAQDDKKDDENSPKKLLRKYKREMRSQMQAFSERAMTIQKELAEEEDGDEKIMEAFKGLREEMAKANDAIIANVLKVAEMVKEDKDVALEAAMLALGRSENGDIKKQAAALVIEHHVDNENLPDSLGQMAGGMPSKTTYDLYQQIIDKTKSDTVRGLTAVAQAGFIEQLQQVAPMIEGNPEFTETYPELAAFVKKMESEFGDEAILKRYEKLVADYGDIESGNSTIKELVGRKIKAIKVRAMTAVGKVAPDIEGPDIDGNSFKLSDYRGKVVMLDFWGDW